MVQVSGSILWYQGPVDSQKVALASFHLEGEANQWWQWVHRTYRDEGLPVTWEAFEEGLWARFRPTDYEDFDQTLSKVKQSGTLHDYQKEFKKLGNRVQGWTQKALMDMFMGGLKVEISKGIRMFKPKTLKEAISLARMKDNQLQRQRKFQQPTFLPWALLALPSTIKSPTLSSAKRLSWEERQKRRAQGLCFNCNDIFTVSHKCQIAWLLLLESSATDADDIKCEEITKEEAGNKEEESPELEISLHVLTGWSTPRTMGVKAQIGHYDFVVLIDSGSTHNFISAKAADMLHRPIIPT
ncbi:Retrotransposon-derived protein PEG10 [Morella rubra]|uniref:Retrotransposon-derived protein PEG10 n=1 Tax=Morella rubra TaxID=262757 RepID=A0A6A1UTH3_9ROSI|nr:Retrotransposon-derived protein PEG10 [Morella rubra]